MHFYYENIGKVIEMNSNDIRKVISNTALAVAEEFICKINILKSHEIMA